MFEIAKKRNRERLNLIDKLNEDINQLRTINDSNINIQPLKNEIADLTQKLNDAMNKNIDIVKKNKEYKQTIDELKETNLFLERDNKLLRIKSTKSPVVQTQSVEIQTEAVEYNNISIQTETVEYNSIEIQCDATIQQQIEDVYINEDIHKLHGFLFELLSKIAKNEKYAAYVEKNENNIRLKKVLSLAKINKINNKIQMKEEELKTVTKQ